MTEKRIRVAVGGMGIPRTVWSWLAAIALSAGGARVNASCVIEHLDESAEVIVPEQGLDMCSESPRGGIHGRNLEEIRHHLKHERSETRARGVRWAVEFASALGGLSKGGAGLHPNRPRDSRRRREGEQAWVWVVEALADDESEVADTAQWLLGQASDPAVLDLLVGREGLRHRSPLVRQRAAEALGRFQGEVDGTSLLQALKRSDVAVCRRVFWSLERLGRRGLLRGDRAKMVRRIEPYLGRSHDERVRADALAALRQVSMEAAGPHLRAALRSGKTPLLRAAAVSLVGEAPWQEGSGDGLDVEGGSSGEDGGVAVSLDLLEETCEDSSVWVRRAAYRSLSRWPSLASLRILVDRLEQEVERDLRELLIAALRANSGRSYSDDVRPWRDWLNTLSGDDRLGGEGQNPPREGRSKAVQRLAELRPSTDAVAILVDLSGSVWMERAGGVSRKDLLDTELLGLLEGFPRSGQFNLIPYASQPDPWKPALIQATPKAIDAAIRGFQRTRLSGRGDVWGAAQVALRDNQVASLLVVTDGAPTGGQHSHMGLLVELLVWECRWRGLAIDSVLIDSSEHLQRAWADLARRTGGRQIAVQFVELTE